MIDHRWSGLRWLTVIVFVVFVSLLLTSCSYSDVHVDRVEWVTDGDTIITSSLGSVRIMGIDAPEYHTPLGNDAKWRVVELIYDKDVTLYCVGVDVYDRDLCDVLVGERMLSDILLDEGLAREWKEN